MKYVIDENVCKNHGISLEGFLYLLTLTLKKPITQATIKEVWNLGAIIINKTENGKILSAALEKTGEDLVTEILEDSTVSNPEPNTNRFLTLAEKLIELYPKGKKPGTAYMWRDSKVVIAKRLKSLCDRTKVSFTDEQAVNATKRYIESFNGNYTYMQLLKYFISKRAIIEGSVEEVSQLLSYIENEDSEQLDNDWTTRTI